MPYCPRCGAGYEASVSRCVDCEVDLVQSLATPEADAEAQERSRVVYEARNELEARAISQMLEAAGIGNTLMAYVTESVFPFSDSKLARVRVHVLEHDVEAARQLIAAFETDASSGQADA